MTNKKFTILISVITCAVMAALGLGQAQQPVKSFTATVVHEVYAAGSAVPWFTYIETVAVRSDGSTVQARHQTRPTDGKPLYGLAIFDVPSKRLIGVDPLTESLTTRPLTKGALDHFTAKATTNCAGKPDGKLLGFAVVLQEKHEVVKIDEPFTKDTRTWTSPDLDCFSLREEKHIVQADGKETFNVRSVTRVVMGEPPAWLFEVPTTYVERSPTEVFAEAARRYPQRFNPPDPSTRRLDEAYYAARKPK